MSKDKLKVSKESKALGLKIYRFMDDNDHFTCMHNGSGIGRVSNQAEADVFCNAFERGWYEGKRQAFKDILKATETHLGGFY